MAVVTTYARLLADLERERIEIDNDLKSLKAREQALKERKEEVLRAINELKERLNDGN